MQRKTKWLSFAWILLLIAIALQAAPHSVVMLTALPPGENPDTLTRLYSYFDPYPFLHYNAAPFLSALSCAAAAGLLCFVLLRKKAAAPFRIVSLILMAAATAASGIAFLVNLTALSAIITGVLAIAFVICILVWPHKTARGSIR